MLVSDPVYALLIHKTSENIPLCFSARASGLFISRDLGNTWQYAYQSLLGDTPLPTLALAEAPMLDGSRIVLAGVPGAVLHSTDFGRTWKVFRLQEPEPVVTALAVSPNFAEDGTAFAATQEDGVFVTSDHGATWTSWNFGLMDVQTFTLAVSPAFASDKQVLVGLSSGLFCSSNRGRSWQPIDLPCGYDAVLSLALSPAYGLDGIGYAGTENHGLLQTLDGGKTWKTIGNGDLQGAINSLVLDPAFPDNPSLGALVDAQLFQSHDGGLNWKPWVTESLPEGFEVTAFAAPEGFGGSAPLWLGSSTGKSLLIK